ncbi:hypothetical protein E7T09_00175 [Deinococcus sp. KSM4-11]|uniref:hypothetical protein n=1 Tax=Deinococcus sp. KSM4-11 TaxID=2568654 RepID=UPI0010A554DE|nr:hypothetical protein [Deinococcus sp. KSM4-11]THF87703.1 hypothetical protein E7T09_00175 [Deinococcus sp. KSM4-11]
MREANTQGKGHHRRTLGLGLLLTATALAAGAIRISINGRVVPGTVVNIGGQNYVPVSALSAAGFKVSTAGGTLSITTTAGMAAAGNGTVAGGSQQLTALSGCLNQTLFNGVWRVKFSNLRLVPEDNSGRWTLDLEVRNGTSKMMTGADGMLMADSTHMAFLAADGTPMNWGTTDELNGQKFTFSQLPPSGVWRGVVTTIDGNNASAGRPPTKLLWRVAPSEGGDFAKALPWGVKDPSFRIDLTCTH